MLKERYQFLFLANLKYSTQLVYFFFSVGYYANEQVQGYILLPLIDLLMSTPASLAISKVAELELLTVLARHDHHKEG